MAKKSRKKPETPRSRVRSALRQLWLRSRERAKALKDAGYRCQGCTVKQSVAKGKEVRLQVHHGPPIDWDGLIDLIFERLLNANQYPLCKKCHDKETEMYKWEKKCKELCREIVMQGGVCENCGHGDKKLDQHHGLFKSSQRYKLNPFLWYDPTVQFCLCYDLCHQHGPDAPHVDQARFEDRMAIRTPNKVKRLTAVNSKPLPPPIDPRIIDWEKVYGNLLEHGRPLGNEICEELTK